MAETKAEGPAPGQVCSAVEEGSLPTEAGSVPPWTARRGPSHSPAPEHCVAKEWAGGEVRGGWPYTKSGPILAPSATGKAAALKRQQINPPADYQSTNTDWLPCAGCFTLGAEEKRVHRPGWAPAWAPPGPTDRIPEVSDQTHTAASSEKAHFSGVKIHSSSDSQGGSNPEEERGVNSTEVGQFSGWHRCPERLCKGSTTCPACWGGGGGGDSRVDTQYCECAPRPQKERSPWKVMPRSFTHASLDQFLRAARQGSKLPPALPIGGSVVWKPPGQQGHRQGGGKSQLHCQPGAGPGRGQTAGAL